MWLAGQSTDRLTSRTTINGLLSTTAATWKKGTPELASPNGQGQLSKGSIQIPIRPCQQLNKNTSGATTPMPSSEKRPSQRASCLLNKRTTTKCRGRQPRGGTPSTERPNSNLMDRRTGTEESKLNHWRSTATVEMVTETSHTIIQATTATCS